MSSPVQLDFSTFKPAPAPSAPAQTGGVSLDFSTFKPHPDAAPQTGMQRVTDSSKDPDWLQPLSGTGAGIIKSGASLVGNILDMVTQSRTAALPRFTEDYKRFINPAATDDEVQKVFDQSIQAHTQKHVLDAATWLKSGGQPEGFWQNVGAIGEQVLEYMGTDGLLKMVGPAAAAVETTEHLKQAQQVAQTIKANPKIAGLITLGLKAAKDATLMGAQTYGHTEDAGQAAGAAATGGVLSGAVGLAGMGVKALRAMGPKALEVAGEEVPVLANQVDEAGKLTGTTATAQGADTIAAQQQTATQAVTRNTAREGLEKSLNRINQTREIIPASHQLPAPADMQPFSFTLGTTPAAEEATGEIVHPAAKGVRQPFQGQTYTTESAPAVAEGTAPRNKGGMGTDVTTEAERPTAEREARGETVGGGGPLTTTSPQQAEQWLRQIEDAKASPEYRKLPAAQQQAIDRAHEGLQNQLGMYYAQGSRFAQRDVPAALGWTNSFGDAAAQARATAMPVYNEMDRASGGDFGKWRDAAKQALGVIQRGSTMEAIETAQQRYAEANDKINELFTRHGSAVSGTDYRAAKMAWRDGATFDMLHAISERMANGVTLEETERGLPRVVKGKPEIFENWLAKPDKFGGGTNRDRAEDLIGRDGVDNMKKMMMLTRDAKLARTTNTVLANIGRVARETFGHQAWPGAVLGGALAQMAGAPGYEGALAGMATGEATRLVMRYATHSPQIGNMVDYAVRNGVSTEHYAPVIARMIAQAAGLEDQGEQGTGTRDQGLGTEEEPAQEAHP